MNQNIQKLLEELYAADPSLRDLKDLEKILAEFIKAKPEVAIDRQFVINLKQQLLSSPAQQKTSVFSEWNPWVWRGAFALGGATLALVVFLTAFRGQIPGTSTSSLNFGRPRVSHLAANAFGAIGTPSLQNSAAPQSDSAKGAVPPARVLAPLSAGAVSGSANSVAPTPAFGLGGGGVEGKMMVPYRPYKLVYRGDPLTLTDQTLDVYKRVSPSNAVSPGALADLKVGGLDLGTFNNPSLGNFEVLQKSDHGYVIDVNVGDGTASINQNWNTWNVCPNGVCPVLPPLTLNDVPADTELTVVADQFLADHHVDRQSYGAAEVNNDWRSSLGDGAPAVYVPDIITVVYPLKINGQEVYNTGGEKKGLQVSVDLRSKKVTGLWGLETEDYQASSYPAETAADTIIKTAENGGGFYGGPILYNGQEGNAAAELALGTPDRVLASVWSNGQELIVPAWRFPVASTTPGIYAPRSVIVPLVKGIVQGGQVVPLMKTMTAPATPVSPQD